MSKGFVIEIDRRWCVTRGAILALLLAAGWFGGRLAAWLGG